MDAKFGHAGAAIATTAYLGKLEVPVPEGATPSRKVEATRGFIRLTLYRHPVKSMYDAPSPAVLAVKVPKTFTKKTYDDWAKKLLADHAKDAKAQEVLAERIRQALAMSAMVGQSKDDARRVGASANGQIERASSKARKVGGLDGLEERWTIGGVFKVAAFVAVHESICYALKVHAIEPYFSADALDKLEHCLDRLRVVTNVVEAADAEAMKALADPHWGEALREILTA